jgi:hypothetical protein
MNPEALLDRPVTVVDFELAAALIVIAAMGIAYARMVGNRPLSRIIAAGGIGAFVGGWLVLHHRLANAVALHAGIWEWAVPVVFAGVASYTAAERSQRPPVVGIIAGIAWGAAVRGALFAVFLYNRMRGLS